MAGSNSSGAKQKGRRIVIGVGNPNRSDDGLGIAAARRIRDRLSLSEVSIDVEESSGEGASLMELWSADDQAVLIDAVRTGRSPGRIVRLDAHVSPIPSDFFRYSTHAFSVAEAVELSRVLGRLPAKLVIYGIEGRSYVAGTELSAEVSGALVEVVEGVLSEFSCSEARFAGAQGGEF